RSPSVRPGEAEQREERVPERRRGETHAPFDRERDLEGREHRLDGYPPALERRDDERDLLGRDAAAEQCEHLVADELERGARAGAFEEAERAVERRRLRRPRLEQGSFEV